MANLAEKQAKGKGDVYGIEGDPATFHLLRSLIITLRSASNAPAVIDLLRILEANFTRLAPSSPHLPSALRRGMKDTLMEIIAEESTVSPHAARCLVEGVERLMGDGRELVMEVTDKHCKARFPKGSGWHALLLHLLLRYSKNGRLLAGPRGSGLKVFKSVLSAVTMETTDVISGAGGREPDWEVADAGTAFVKWYVMRLAKGLNKGWSSGSSKAEIGFRDVAVLVIRR